MSRLKRPIPLQLATIDHRRSPSLEIPSANTSNSSNANLGGHQRWPPSNNKPDAPPAPSPFDDYHTYPFHWTGESLNDAPIESYIKAPNSSSIIEDNTSFTSVSQADENFQTQRNSLRSDGSDRDTSRKRGPFRHIRQVMSLGHMKHKNPSSFPDTAPPTPTVTSQDITTFSEADVLMSLESLHYWQLPEPQLDPFPLSPSTPLFFSHGESHRSHSSFDSPHELSPPSSVPSSDVLRDSETWRARLVLPPLPPQSIELPTELSAISVPLISNFGAELFDGLDISDSKIVKRDATGKIIAGTVEGLVAFITQPEIIDYELLSDFFLTYRNFISPMALLELLGARFEWGLITGREQTRGMVLVRTFVALRHWLLNYFADDFASSQPLRSQFVHVINCFARDPRVRSIALNTRIIAELKRCWRRACRIYWDAESRSSADGGWEKDITECGNESKNVIGSEDQWLYQCASAGASLQKRSEKDGRNSSIQIKGRTAKVPSLILRATREREEQIRREREANVPHSPLRRRSKSQPELRTRFLDTSRPEFRTLPSRRLRLLPEGGWECGHVRNLSTPVLEDESKSLHKRNASAEAKVLESKYSNPTLFQSLARGDGRKEWPLVIVRPDLLVTSPKASSIDETQQQKKRTFRMVRKKIAGTAVMAKESGTNRRSHVGITCGGQLSDEEEYAMQEPADMSVSVAAGTERVDFLAAGMWNSLMTAANESQASLISDDIQENIISRSPYEKTFYQQEISNPKMIRSSTKSLRSKLSSVIDPIHDRTLSMSGVDRRSRIHPVASCTGVVEYHSRPTLISSSSTRASDTVQDQNNLDVRRRSLRLIISPTPPLTFPQDQSADPHDTRFLRRRPGGDLRKADTIDQLAPRSSFASFASSYSGYSIALAADNSSNMHSTSFSNGKRADESLAMLPSPAVEENGRQRQSPVHHASGMGMDFRSFMVPDEVESSDDDGGAFDAVGKALLKLEGRYIRKQKQRHRRSSIAQSRNKIARTSKEEDLISKSTMAFRDNGTNYMTNRTPGRLGDMLPTVENIYESEKWTRRHKQVVAGQEVDAAPQHDSSSNRGNDHPTRQSSSLEVSPTSLRLNKAPLAQKYSLGIETLHHQNPAINSNPGRFELQRRQTGFYRQARAVQRAGDSVQIFDLRKELTAHLPFVLQYDSKLLAQQFTLIERDILAEIDWEELVETSWEEKNADVALVRDWKAFVTDSGMKGGLRTCIARFNLTAGWVASEIVLTQNIKERVMVIEKFIRIARHCYHLHNFATFMQIFTGLQSSHISALKRSWELVSNDDRQTWKSLKEFADPGGNWINLRIEMNQVAATPPTKNGSGCIPFMGLCMKDLILNAPKLSVDGMVDFAGHRLTASIVKKFLRLIELADCYEFTPEDGVAERCIWITALEEDLLGKINAEL